MWAALFLLPCFLLADIQPQGYMALTGSDDATVVIHWMGKECEAIVTYQMQTDIPALFASGGGPRGGH